MLSVGLNHCMQQEFSLTGLTNTVTAVKNAQMAETPVLLMGGAAASLLKGRGALQDIDQMCLFKPLCKFTATITRIRDIAPTVRKALQAAVSGTPGMKPMPIYNQVTTVV
jgi:acetolactate synthase-like protein